MAAHPTLAELPRMVRRARRLLNKEAKRLNPDMHGRDRVQRIMNIERRKIPKEKRLIQAFEGELQNLAKKYTEKNFAPDPGLQLVILERDWRLFLPSFAMNAYLPTSPFDRSATASIFVPKLPKGMKPKTREKFLQSAYNLHEIQVSLAGNTFGGPGNGAYISNYAITTTGTYYLRVSRGSGSPCSAHSSGTG